MGNCENCTFWKPPSLRTTFEQIFRWDPDKDKRADTKYGMCRRITLASEWDDPPDPLPLAVTKDGSDYKAELYTLPTFGCVEFEAM